MSKCHHLFKRLDTHYRVSATCKKINTIHSPNTPNMPSSLEQFPPNTSTAEEAIFFTAHNSNSAASAPAAMIAGAITTNTAGDITTNTTPTKESPNLPKTPEAWEKADYYFKTILVPTVLAATSPQDMNTILCEGIYSFFALTHGSKTSPAKKTKKRPLHNRVLKEVERKEKEAMRELKSANRSGSPSEVVHSIADRFFSLVRAHNQLKKVSNARLQARDVKAARGRCYRDFRGCAREVLDGKLGQELPPAFSDEVATTFFSRVYSLAPRGFIQPDWMPSPSLPEVELDCRPFSPREVTSVIKRMKTQSAPSPFDRVGYVVFKKCPSLIPALVRLFNTCWDQSVIPGEWKCAAIKLIPKSSASDDTANPANFRPIALTPCIGKLFTSILRNRWLRYMRANKYLNPSLQKAFMPTVPGCTENHIKLSSILAEAHSNHRSVTVCWLDLANAYGSVLHSLINFSLQHYHTPLQFLAIVQALYTGLNAKVITAEWETPVIPFQKGVYQGDPLSTVIFNTVINTLLDTISRRSDLGYQFSNSQRRINILQYADDTCLVADSPASCQHLLNTMAVWLQWTGIEAKIPKCQCLSLKSSTGRLADPHLTLDGVSIPFTTNPVRFLGMQVQVPKDHAAAREAVLTRLRGMMVAIDRTQLTRKQKLRLYSGGVCP